MNLRPLIFYFTPLFCIVLINCKSTSLEQPATDFANHQSTLTTPSFTKLCIDSVFRSEAVVSADINQDGLQDIVVGDVWYAAPQWQMHEIRTPGIYYNKIYSDDSPSTLPYYSNSFGVYTVDVNQDGWPDVLTFPTMGQPIYWYENPKHKSGHWKEDIVVDDYHGESPLLVDLFGTGQYGVLCGVNDVDSLYQLAYSTVAAAGTWETLIVGSTSTYAFKGPFWGKRIKQAAAGAFAHGLGTGDLNGDGFQDIITRNGWYEGASSSSLPLKFNAVPFDTMASAPSPNLQFAQMIVYDVDQDGDNDIIGSSAHQYGIWWFEQIIKSGEIEFIKHVILDDVSQAHAIALGDMNNNGIPDFVTGKRYLAHNGRDPGWDDAVDLVWMEAYQKGGETHFHQHKFDQAVGVGTQIHIKDINNDGWDDLLISNKKGTFLFKNGDKKIGSW